MNTHDATSIVALMADDVTWEDLAMGLVFEGHDAVKASIEEAEKYSTDYRYTSLSEQASGALYAIEWEVAGTTTGQAGGMVTTDTGDMVGGGPAGTPYRIRGVSVGQLDADGKIKSNRDYYNMADYLKQVGGPHPRANRTRPNLSDHLPGLGGLILPVDGPN